MAHATISLAIVAVLIMSQGVIAKRGCAAFGHSCFGGHGKRAADFPLDSSNQEISAPAQLSQEETPPHPGYPRSYSLPGDDYIPVRDGGLYDRDESAAREVMKLKLRSIVKRWMDSYRRSQNTDGYLMENL